MEVLQTPPVPLGGTIAPGLYFLTKFNVYRTQSGAPLSTVQLASNMTTNTYSINSYVHGSQQLPVAGTYATSGTMLNRNYLCPNNRADSYPFTATPSTLILYEGGGTLGTFELIETKQ
jgi:hypothetical protein